MYISEIAPVNLRGVVGIVNQLAITIGLLFSQVFNCRQYSLKGMRHLQNAIQTELAM